MRPDALDSSATVADLPVLLLRVLGMRPHDPPFGARYTYDGQGRLVIEFSEDD